jgi:RND family efflux transporter MFP subunit
MLTAASMAKWWVVGTSVVVLGGGLGILVYARREKAAGKPPAAATSSAPAKKPVEEPAAPKDYLGVIVAPQVVDVAARLDARIAELKVRVGDHVAKDAPIAVLDVRAQEADLVVQKAALKAAQAAENHARVELSQARDKLERDTKLKAANAIAEEEVAIAKYQEKLAEANVENTRAGTNQADARVKQLQIELSDAVIKAPFDGVVAVTYADPGALVHASSQIVRLISGDRLWVRFAVPEEQARALAQGAAVKVAVPTLNTDFDGKIESVAPEVDPAARMIFSEARLTIPDEWKSRVPAGSVARVRLL